MLRAGAVDRQAVVALVVAIPVALLIVVTFSPFRNMPEVEAEPLPAPRPKAKAPGPKGKTPAPKAEPPAPALDSAGVAPPPREVTDAVRMERARRGCRLIADAIEAYIAHPDNPGAERADKFPASPADLVNPPFGAAFLPNGQEDLIDPWGLPYQFRLNAPDARPPVLIFTRAPDRTPVSQFGIGPESRVKD